MTLCILGIVLSLLFEAFFSSSEIAMLSCDINHLRRLAKGHNRSARYALLMLSNLEKVITLSLLGTNVGVAVTTTLMHRLFDRYIHIGNPNITSLIFASLTVLLFGELIPKSLGQRFAMEWTLTISPFHMVLQKILYVFLKIVTGYTKLLRKLFGISEGAASPLKFTSQELLGVLKEAEVGRTDLLSNELEFVSNILELSDVRASDIMTPLVNVRAVEEKTLLSDCLKLAQSNWKFSKIPVFRGRVDNIVGVVHIKDFFSQNLTSQSREVMQKPVFVSEFQTLKELFSTFEDNSAEIVFVVDEYGGVVGMLTLEDLLEEVVGEIYDEYDQDEMKIKVKKQEGGYLVVGNVSFEKLLSYLHIENYTNNYIAESLGGVIMEELGRIPPIGTKICLLEAIDCEIVEVSSKRIELIFVRVLDPQ